MVKLWKGVVETVDWAKKRVLLRGQEPGHGGAGENGFIQVLSWDVLTRVTAPDRGLIPIQQLQAGQRIDADCVREPDGGWLARAIEVILPQGIGTGAQAKKSERG